MTNEMKAVLENSYMGQEIIEYIESQELLVRAYRDECDVLYERLFKMSRMSGQEAFDILQEIVDKYTKPHEAEVFRVNVDGEYREEYYTCPHCGEDVSYCKYCPNCGLMIKEKDKDEN